MANEDSAFEVWLFVRLAYVRVVLVGFFKVQTGQPDALRLCWVMVDLRGQVSEGKTQFLPLASCHWLVSCRAVQLNKL